MAAAGTAAVLSLVVASAPALAQDCAAACMGRVSGLKPDNVSGILLAFCTLAGLVATALLAGAWRGPARPGFLDAWTGYAALGAATAGILALDRLVPGVATFAVRITATNALLLFGSGLLWAGARRLRGARARAWLVALPPLLWLAASGLVPGFHESLLPRILIAAPLYVLLHAAAAFECLRRHRGGGAPRILRALAILTALTGAAHLARIGLVVAGMEALAFNLIAIASASLLLVIGVGGVALAGELSARREAMALQAARAEVERLHAGLPAIVFLHQVDPDGGSRRVYHGGDFEAVLGWPEPALARQNSLAGFTDPGAPHLKDVMRQTLRHGSAVHEWRMRQPDGSFTWIRTHMRRLSQRPDGGGEVVGYRVNITAERAAEARSLAAARLASLGEMAASLAHEMRQPLAVITLSVENAQRALARGDIAAAAPRLQRARDQALRAGTMIEHLRRFARGTEEAAPLAPVGLDLAVEGALALVGGALREAGIAVELDLGTPPAVVLGHLVPLEQVLVNLLGNARDAMAPLPPGARRRVRILAESAAGPQRDMVLLSVADSGGGVAEAVLPRLFEPFVSTKGSERGTGLGLSICHGLVTAMGGTIAAANDADGAVFRLALPMAPSEAVAGLGAAAPALSGA